MSDESNEVQFARKLYLTHERRNKEFDALGLPRSKTQSQILGSTNEPSSVWLKR
jgi:hypothetical protein